MAPILRTDVDIQNNELIGESTNLLFLGSCFADRIGSKFNNASFNSIVNPWGVIYNPVSLAIDIRNAIDGKSTVQSQLIQHDDLWHSMLHHGSFSNAEQDQLIEEIQKADSSVHDFYNSESGVVILT